MALFLGLDASTQALKASLLSSNLDVLSEVAVNFDADLPKYGTNGGVLLGPKGSGEVFSPVMMVVEAIDLLMDRIRDKGWKVEDVRGVAGAGQQHASVYWNARAHEILSSLDPSLPLVEQLSPAFSRPIMPNWQDSSTTRECQEIEAALGGPDQLAQATGSRAHERFTGPQIMRFKRTDPDAYAQTSRISLCSSFITTLLCTGDVKPIDESDACGMNLWTMDREERGWNERVLAVIDPDLPSKLGDVERDGGRVQGTIGRWYVERYGFHPDCCVFPGTGDNPATFLSLTLTPSEGLVSLGTSDVVLVSTSTYNPDPEYHAFFHPAQDGSGELRYFNMLVYKNGSLARQRVRDEFFDRSWEAFNDAVEATRPESGVLHDTAFWWLLPEIIPHGASGVHRYTDSGPVTSFPDKRLEALTILESQFMNYRSRSSAILHTSDTPSRPSTPVHGVELPRMTRVYATGGASVNRSILGVMADVLNAPICKNVEYSPSTGKWSDATWNSCSVGVAYKARWGWERHRGREISFDAMIDECRAARQEARPVTAVDESLETEGIRVVASPTARHKVYEQSMAWWEALEQRAMRTDQAG